jgi:hypothetical protein
LKKSVKKRCLVFLLLFNFIDVQSLRSVKMSLNFESLSRSKNSNNDSAQFNIFFLKARLIEFTVNPSPDNRGSTVFHFRSAASCHDLLLITNCLPCVDPECSTTLNFGSILSRLNPVHASTLCSCNKLHHTYRQVDISVLIDT